MYFGVDYYPEHWVYPYAGTPEEPEARWKRDAELMSAAGVNVVRMGEFAWGLYEPDEGHFNFDWMRRAMDIMAESGIEVVLGDSGREGELILPALYDRSRVKFALDHVFVDHLQVAATRAVAL